ncbi:MAG: Protoheme farnesyltransferase [Candidatus Saccharibacteria bacterium]|nr:Protoheme farnesyltransferase [Candidatus Saccharibacteria bacterium]
MERHTRSYLQLMKPGITLGNSISALAGFFLAASQFGFSLTALIGAIGGIIFVIASACVVNNIIDRDLDKKMKRTKGREVAAGVIPVPSAIIYAVVLGVIGFGLLALWTNWLTFGLGILSYIWYVVVYGIAKRTTPLSTIIGGVCGALPPVAGYTSLSGQIDMTAIILFALLMVWQLPHFYAISIFRHDDYKNAKLPVWSVRYGIPSTKKQIFFWVVIFALLSPLLTLLGPTGLLYLIVMLGLSIYWVYQGARYYNDDDVRWAKRMFGASLIIMMAMSAIIGVGGYLL